MTEGRTDPSAPIVFSVHALPLKDLEAGGIGRRTGPLHRSNVSAYRYNAPLQRSNGSSQGTAQRWIVETARDTVTTSRSIVATERRTTTAVGVEVQRPIEPLHETLARQREPLRRSNAAFDRCNGPRRGTTVHWNGRTGQRNGRTPRSTVTRLGVEVRRAAYRYHET